jgi:aminopeptidase N
VASHIGQSLIDQFELREKVDKVKIKDQGHLFIFEECPPISTYIYALAVGAY